DTYLGRTISVLLFIQNFDDYRREHIYDHHSTSHMTIKDPTVQFLLLLVGLRPGMTRAQCWRQLRRTLWSPIFHARFLQLRLVSAFAAPRWSHRLASITTVLMIIGVVAVAQAWIPFLVAYVFPLTVLYQISACLRLCVKHTFPAPGIGQ